MPSAPDGKPPCVEAQASCFSALVALFQIPSSNANRTREVCEATQGTNRRRWEGKSQSQTRRISAAHAFGRSNMRGKNKNKRQDARFQPHGREAA